MSFTLLALPYAPNALEPFISEETLTYHHGKHHATYVDKLNGLLTGNYNNEDLPQIIIDHPTGPIFNNAAQIWNHTFYWHCLTPDAKGPSANLEQIITQQFGSLADFKEQFTQQACTLFGSGWVWLSLDKNQKLIIESLPNAGVPISHGHTPLLTCDVWEHAYYIDTRNSRPDYLKNFWELVNWQFVETNLEQSN